MARRLISSGGPWEARFGYSRAVAVGDEAFVSGSTDAGPDGHSLHPGDPAGQARTRTDTRRESMRQLQEMRGQRRSRKGER